MSKKDESILLISELLEKTVSNGKSNMSKLSNIEKAKKRGIVVGAELGLSALTRLKCGESHDSIDLTFNSKLRQSVYSLFIAENEYELGNPPNERVKCDIVYYDNLITTLQLLKRRFKKLHFQS